MDWHIINMDWVRMQVKYGGKYLLLENPHFGEIVTIIIFAEESTCETCLENENANGELILG